MAEWLDRYGSVESGYKAMTGQQHYFLVVKGPAFGVPLSVVSFEAVEKIGEPYRITIEVTHPAVLARSDYLGRDAVFTIDPRDFTDPRTFSGCVTRFSQIKTTKDLTVYRIVVEAHIARLKLTRSSRIYQNRTAPEIIEAVLRRHDFRGHQFLFKLRRKYPEHKFRFQYQVDDWTYIQILMQQEGIYSYIVPGEFGDIVVFGDDIDHYIYKPILRVPYREASGLVPPKAPVYGEPRAEWVSALQTHMETVPASFLVADYNPEKAFERYKAEGTLRARTLRPTVNLIYTARTIWIAWAPSGKRSCVTKRRLRGKSCTRAKATCLTCDPRVFYGWMWHCRMRPTGK